ncbi:MAG: DUF262 domain-containing HNH endonuclease family protein [Candidatus Bathyarchaeia archaeon]
MPRRANVHVGTSTFYFLFNQENKLNLPMFQRDYSWEEEELTKFWEDIVKTMKGHGQEHFIGQIVLGRVEPVSQPASHILKNFYHIIDGQQRIITATIFLCALRDVATENGHKEIAKNIQRYVTTVSNSPSQDNDFIVTLGYADREFFKNFIQFEIDDPRRKKEDDYRSLFSVGKTKRSNELIYDAYKFFRERISNEITNYTNVEKANYFTRLQDCFLRDFFFIEVRLPDINEGSQIFETMNAYGERLEAIDLVKNLVFMKRHSQGVATSILESELVEWNDSVAKLKNVDPSRFLRHYWLSKYKDTEEPVTIENLYRTFSQKAENEPTFINQLLTDIREYSDIYMVLNQPEFYRTFNKKPAEIKKVEAALTGLDAMNASRAFPLLMSTFKNFPEQFPRMCRLIEVLVFRYSLICNLDAKRLEKKFNEISVAFENADKSNVTGATSLFEEKVQELKSEIPSVEQFENSFKYKSTWTSKAARYVLAIIEMSEGTGEHVLSQSLSLEHIFPKSPSEECKNEVGADLDKLLPKINSIGNLTLILGKWNQTMSNKKFSDKKRDFYSKSEIKITKELSTLESWNSTEVEKRTMRFSKKCVELWNPNSI